MKWLSGVLVLLTGCASANLHSSAPPSLGSAPAPPLAMAARWSAPAAADCGAPSGLLYQPQRVWVAMSRCMLEFGPAGDFVALHRVPFDVDSAGVTDGEVILVPQPHEFGVWVCTFPAYECRRVTHVRGLRAVLFGDREMLMDYGAQGAVLVEPDPWAIRYLDDPHGAIRDGARHVRDSRLIRCPTWWGVIARESEVRRLESQAAPQHAVPPLDRPFHEEVGDRTLLFSRYGDRAHDPCRNTPVRLPAWLHSRSRFAWIRLPGAAGVTAITPLVPTVLATADGDDALVAHRYRYQRADRSAVLTMPSMAGAGDAGAFRHVPCGRR
ncbi:MAG: hypothetical protein AB8I08_01390 [Sandaracinaceae bacterium]